MTTTNATVPDTPAELVEQGEPPATNVIEALRRVIRDLPAIGKEGTGPSSQGSYKYRGIEQITRHAAPLFAKHGLVMAPNAIVWRPTRELMVSGKPNTDEALLVTYRVYGPGGVEDYIEVQAPGIGRDSSDKGSNKAMTAAFKYALTQTLCVADEKDDNDARHDDEDEPPPEAPADAIASPEQYAEIRKRTQVLRDRGVEVTETNDLKEATIFGVQILKRLEGEDERLVRCATVAQADALLLRLADEIVRLADRLLEEGTEPPATAPSAPAEGSPGPEEADALHPPERARTEEQRERERVAREQLASVASKGKGKADAPEAP